MIQIQRDLMLNNGTYKVVQEDTKRKLGILD